MTYPPPNLEPAPPPFPPPTYRPLASRRSSAPARPPFPDACAMAVADPIAPSPLAIVGGPGRFISPARASGLGARPRPVVRACAIVGWRGSGGAGGRRPGSSSMCRDESPQVNLTRRGTGDNATRCEAHGAPPGGGPMWLAAAGAETDARSAGALDGRAARARVVVRPCASIARRRRRRHTQQDIGEEGDGEGYEDSSQRATRGCRGGQVRVYPRALLARICGREDVPATHLRRPTFSDPCPSSSGRSALPPEASPRRSRMRSGAGMPLRGRLASSPMRSHRTRLTATVDSGAAVLGPGSAGTGPTRRSGEDVLDARARAPRAQLFPRHGPQMPAAAAAPRRRHHRERWRGAQTLEGGRGGGALALVGYV